MINVTFGNKFPPTLVSSEHGSKKHCFYYTSFHKKNTTLFIYKGRQQLVSFYMLI